MVPWAVAIAAVLAVGAAPSPQPVAPEAAAFVATDYHAIASVTEVRAALAAALREVVGEPMADRGQRFQATDARARPAT